MTATKDSARSLKRFLSAHGALLAEVCAEELERRVRTGQKRTTSELVAECERRMRERKS